jgi:predicted SnoaL-like aldol condensation-catalyzing enzyme
MKKLPLALAAGLLSILISCNTKTSNSSSENSDSSKEGKNRMANEEIYKGIETGDSSKFSVIADDAVDHGDPSHDMKGDSIRKFLTGMHNHINDLKIDIISEAANGDYVFTLSRMTGTTKDSTMGMPAGMKMDSKSVDVLKFKDGKAVEHWSFMDPKEMMQMQNMNMRNMPMHDKMDSTKK